MSLMYLSFMTQTGGSFRKRQTLKNPSLDIWHLGHLCHHICTIYHVHDIIYVPCTMFMTSYMYHVPCSWHHICTMYHVHQIIYVPCTMFTLKTYLNYSSHFRCLNFQAKVPSLSMLHHLKRSFCVPILLGELVRTLYTLRSFLQTHCFLLWQG